MATRTVSNTGGNWSVTTTWVGGVVPLAGDDVNFTATSGPLTVNVSTANLIGINFTNYINTITFNQPITTNGIVNLGTNGYTQDGTSGLIINGATTISGTTIWSRTISFTGTTYVVTLSNTLNITGQVTFSQTGTLSFSVGANTFNPTGPILITRGTTTLPNNINITNLNIIPSTTSAPIFNTNTINISENLTLNSSVSGMTFSGTTNLVLTGTGTWTGSSTSIQLRNNLTINASGTITISGIVYYNTGILTYTTGTVVTTGSTLNCALSTTFNCGNMDGVTTNKWNNIVFSAGTQTLTSSLNISGNLTTQTTAVIINGLFNVNVGGNLTINIATSGTSTIVLNGTGTWSHGSAVYLSNNLTINTSGTITIGTNIYYRTGTLTYTAGIVDTTTNNSTLNLHGLTTSGSLILTTNGITWKNVFIVVSSGLTLTITLTNNFNISGNISLGQSTTYSAGTITFTGVGLLSPTGAGDLLVPSTGGSAIVLNLTSDITINNFIVTSGTSASTSGGITINSFIITILSNLRFAGGNGVSVGGYIIGTGSLIMAGNGTWSSDTVPFQFSGGWYNVVGVNLTFNTSGTINVLGSVGIGTSSASNKTIRYISGNVDASSSTLYLGGGNTNVTFNTNSMMWGNVYFYRGTQTGSDGITLTSDLNMTGLLLFTQPSSVNATSFVLNGSGFKINLASLQVSHSISTISGTATIVFNKSGYWYHTTAIPIQNNVEIDINGSLILFPIYYQTGVLTYKKGNVLTKNLSLISTLNLTAACTLINCHKINFDRVVITSGVTITMNEFFNGSPGLKTTITPSSTTNYTITFQDRFEKFSKFVKVSRATLSNPGQLTVTTNKGNQLNNIGIKFAPNQIANGLAKNTPSTPSTSPFGIQPSLLMTDPTLS